MRRRTLLGLGIGGAAVLAVAGGGLSMVRPGYQRGALTPAGRRVFLGTSRAVLDGCLPADSLARERALQGQLIRLNATIAALPLAVREDLSRLLALLDTRVGRRVLAGLPVDWSEATQSELQAAFQGMRVSSVALRAQAYHALRDLTNAAYFADPAHWHFLGYPGPTAVQA